MSTVTIRPGDTVNIVIAGTMVSPLGTLPAETVMPFTYEDLLGHIGGPKSARSKSRKSRTEGRRASRHIALMLAALMKGVWSTGAPINRVEITNDLIALLEGLSVRDVFDLTPNAKKRLAGLLDFEGYAYVTKELADAIRKIFPNLNSELPNPKT